MISCNGSINILLELDLCNLFIVTQSFLLYSWLTSSRYLCTTKVQNVLNSERLILSIDCIIIAIELDPAFIGTGQSTSYLINYKTKTSLEKGIYWCWKYLGCCQASNFCVSSSDRNQMELSGHNITYFLQFLYCYQIKISDCFNVKKMLFLEMVL